MFYGLRGFGVCTPKCEATQKYRLELTKAVLPLSDLEKYGEGQLTEESCSPREDA